MAGKMEAARPAVAGQSRLYTIGRQQAAPEFRFSSLRALAGDAQGGATADIFGNHFLSSAKVGKAPLGRRPGGYRSVDAEAVLASDSNPA